MVCFYSYFLFRCQCLYQMSQQFLVQWEPHFLFPEGDRVSGVVRAVRHRSVPAGRALRSPDVLRDGCVCAIPEHAHSQGFEPGALLPAAVLVNLLFFQLAGLHRRATGLDVSPASARVRHQLCLVHLLHPGEDQPGSSGVRSQDSHQPPS